MEGLRVCAPESAFRESPDQAQQRILKKNPEPTKNKAVFVLDHKNIEATIEAAAPLLCARSDEMGRCFRGARRAGEKKAGPDDEPGNTILRG